MISGEILDAEFTFPGDTSILEGRLYLDPKNPVMHFLQNPNGRYSYKTIPVVFIKIKRNNTTYTAVQSVFSKSSNDEVHYEISELYKGEYLVQSDKKIYNELGAEVTHFTNWLNPRLISYKLHSGEKQIGVKDGVEHTFTIDKDHSIHFRGYYKLHMESNETRIAEYSNIWIISSIPASRQQLVSKWKSFLNFYTLFLGKLPYTTVLEFHNENSTVEMINMFDEEHDSLRNVLLQLQDIPDFQQLLQRYFQLNADLDKVVDLFSACMKQMDAEIKFLHLTQALETFHRRFYENDQEAWNQVVAGMHALFSKFKKPNKMKWIQAMRYYHLYLFASQKNEHLLFPLDAVQFIGYLTDSRNFYTHHEPKEQVWTPFELYEANRILRRWLRFLLFEKIGLPASLYKKLAVKEKFITEDLDIEKNPWSMHYNG